MSKYEASLILFGVLFIVIFLLDYIFIKSKYLRKKGKKKNKNDLIEISYLVGKFKLNKSEILTTKLLLLISLINAFIIAFVSVVVLLINTYIILQLLVGFILLITLIYSIYELLGRHLVKRGFVK